MIELLSNNQNYRLSLENTVHSWDSFAAQVMHIIDKETTWTWRDIFDSLIRPILELMDIICTMVQLFSLNKEAKSTESKSNDDKYVKYLEIGSTILKMMRK